MPKPVSLERSISPPALRKVKKTPRSDTNREHEITNGEQPKPADVEAGVIEISDHLAYFSTQHSKVIRVNEHPRLSIEQFRALYLRNQHSTGRHYVIHQHDHPISGTHYDLRLQFSATSCISFAIPYGLPLNPNSRRPNRMAIETRVHNLWNNLIESASHATGSLLIWDTGEYEVVDDRPKQDLTDDEHSGDDRHDLVSVPDSDRLRFAFKDRHIRLRLTGSRLPKNYTISLRLPSSNMTSARQSKSRRKRVRGLHPSHSSQPVMTDEESGTDTSASTQRITEEESEIVAAAVASDQEDDEGIRRNNAYPGSSNTIGSIQQRHWLITLDRVNSGFEKTRAGSERGRWVGRWDAMVVRGRDHERSVVTGRSADEVLLDEGIENFVGRRNWRPITE